MDAEWPRDAKIFLRIGINARLRVSLLGNAKIHIENMLLIYTLLLSCALFSNEHHTELIPLQSAHYKRDTSQVTATLFVFTGSDWCRECKRLKKKVLEDTAFSHAMKAHQIAIELIDFPQRKKLDVKVVERNEWIAEKYNFDGVFPTLVLSAKHNANFQRLYYRNENGEAFSQKIVDELRKLQKQE
ncbi:MAG: thioredoxin fold domain-containing protein [Bacteroidota bacterium]